MTPITKAFDAGGATAFAMAAMINTGCGYFGWWTLGVAICATMAVILYVKQK